MPLRDIATLQCGNVYTVDRYSWSRLAENISNAEQHFMYFSINKSPPKKGEKREACNKAELFDLI